MGFTRLISDHSTPREPVRGLRMHMHAHAHTHTHTHTHTHMHMHMHTHAHAHTLQSTGARRLSDVSAIFLRCLVSKQGTKVVIQDIRTLYMVPLTMIGSVFLFKL